MSNPWVGATGIEPVTPPSVKERSKVQSFPPAPAFRHISRRSRLRPHLEITERDAKIRHRLAPG